MQRIRRECGKCIQDNAGGLRIGRGHRNADTGCPAMGDVRPIGRLRFRVFRQRYDPECILHIAQKLQEKELRRIVETTPLREWRAVQIRCLRRSHLIHAEKLEQILHHPEQRLVLHVQHQMRTVGRDHALPQWIEPVLDVIVHLQNAPLIRHIVHAVAIQVHLDRQSLFAQYIDRPRAVLHTLIGQVKIVCLQEILIEKQHLRRVVVPDVHIAAQPVQPIVKGEGRDLVRIPPTIRQMQRRDVLRV